MQILSDAEIDFVTGGNGQTTGTTTTPPVCTTSGNTTTCSCPAGSSLTVQQSGTYIRMVCVKPAT